MPFSRRPKADLVVVAVRYRETGEIEWVRAYERRGPTWSDRKNIRRADLIERLQAGEKVVTGERIPYEAGTFDFGEALRLEKKNGHEVVVSGRSNGRGDALEAVPIV